MANIGKKSREVDAKALRPLLNLATTTTSVTDHGNLTGLEDDDHSQYLHVSARRTVTAQHSFAPSVAQAPFELGANAQGQTVKGLKADQLDKSVVAGSGLTGGGALTANVTLNVGAGTGISVLADAVAVNTAYAFTWEALHIFGAGLRVATGQSLQFGSDVALSRKAANILQPGSGDALESPTYTSGLQGWHIDSVGDAEFNNVRIRGELVTAIFTYNEIAATAGTFGVFKSAASLYMDWTSPASVGGSNTLAAVNDELGGMLFAVNDILWIKGFDGTGIQSCWLKVTARANMGDYTNYTVKLENGSTSKTFRAGLGIADYGPSGSGAITLSADGAIGSTPNISLITHAGTPWTTQTLRTRIGNLNGSYGITTNIYGIGVGDYTSGDYLRYDTTNGFLISIGGGSVTLDGDGISLESGSTLGNEIKWYDGTSKQTRIWGFVFGNTSSLYMHPYTFGAYTIGEVMIAADESYGVNIKVKTGGTIELHGTAQVYNDLEVSSGLCVGDLIAASDGNIIFTGNLQSRKSTTNYDVFGFHPLTIPLTSTSWDGDSYSDVSTSTRIDLSAVFGAPAGIKAVLLEIVCNDSAAWGTDGLYFACGPSALQWYTAACRPAGGDVRQSIIAVTPCDANGDVWYRINASGPGTMDVVIRIWGYWI